MADVCHILSIAERFRERTCDVYGALCDGIATMFHVFFNLSPKEARDARGVGINVGYTGPNSDELVGIKYTAWFDSGRSDEPVASPGTISACSPEFAAWLEDSRIAVRISDDEANEYFAKHKRYECGGWMDDPIWKRFAGKLARLHFASSLSSRSAA